MTAHFRVAFKAATNADLRHVFRLTDSAGVPIDLTDTTLHMRLAGPTGDTALDLTRTNGLIAVIEPTSGQFEVAISAATLALLAPADYTHDLIMTTGTRRRRLWAGYLSLESGVTP
jgi:hypothetical protein